MAGEAANTGNAGQAEDPVVKMAEAAAAVVISKESPAIVTGPQDRIAAESAKARVVVIAFELYKRLRAAALM